MALLRKTQRSSDEESKDANDRFGEGDGKSSGRNKREIV